MRKIVDTGKMNDVRFFSFEIKMREGNGKEAVNESEKSRRFVSVRTINEDARIRRCAKNRKTRNEIVILLVKKYSEVKKVDRLSPYFKGEIEIVMDGVEMRKKRIEIGRGTIPHT